MLTLIINTFPLERPHRLPDSSQTLAAKAANIETESQYQLSGSIHATKLIGQEGKLRFVAVARPERPVYPTHQARVASSARETPAARAGFAYAITVLVGCSCRPLGVAPRRDASTAS